MQSSCTRAIRIASILSVLALMVFADRALCHATKPAPRVTVSGKVLLGDARRFHSVGTVDRRAIFEALPAIRTLRMDRVPRDSARYHFLIYEANREFQKAIASAAQERQVDLVVEAGGVTAAGIDILDLSARALAAVSKTERT